MNGGTRILTLLMLSVSGLLSGGALQQKEKTDMTTVRVRYMVNELDPAVEFYTKYLGFQVKQQNKPNFAMLSLGTLDFVLSTPYGPGGAAKPMPDGRKPEPGGWNRIIINVDDRPAEVARLRKARQWSRRIRNLARRSLWKSRGTLSTSTVSQEACPSDAFSLLAKASRGSARSCSTMENKTSAGMDLSYNKPMIALPANQATPKPVSKMPKAVLRLSDGTTADSTALRHESCAPIPIPHRIIPINSSVVPRRKTSGSKNAGTPKATRRMGRPSLSNNFPRNREASAPVAIATA